MFHALIQLEYKINIHARPCNILYTFYFRISQLSRSVQSVYWYQNLLKAKHVTPGFSSKYKYRKLAFCRSRFPKYVELSHFMLLLLSRKQQINAQYLFVGFFFYISYLIFFHNSYNARAYPLYHLFRHHPH